jgi:hypothetical protein
MRPTDTAPRTLVSLNPRKAIVASCWVVVHDAGCRGEHGGVTSFTLRTRGAGNGGF